MSATVNVLSPNGRRQNVKVTPNTTVLQILEEVCLKQKFDSSLYDLRHGRLVVDATSTYRFSGIPNNAKLEMVTRETPRSSIAEVVIALQLESGERRQNQFKTGISLFQIIASLQRADETLLKSDSSTMPVVIFMRDEIIGLEALSQTTVKDLGILSGKAMLRLLHRPRDESALEKVSQQLQIEQKKIEKYTKVEKTSSPTTEQSDVRPKVKPLERSSEPICKQEPMELSDTMMPSQTQFTNTTKSACEGATSFTQNSKVQTDKNTADESMMVNKPIHKQRDPVSLAEPSGSSSRKIQRIGVAGSSHVPHAPQYEEFKFPEATAGQKLYKNDMSDVQKSDYLPCEREAVLYDAQESFSTSTATASTEQDVPDDFYDVTKDDLQKMIRHLREQMYADENAPLMTSSMRQAKLEASATKYDSAVIRFHFPDKLVLQAKFKPRETVHSLKKFVKSHLKKSEDSFYLYVTPPKRTLNDAALTLIQAHLVPLSVVYVGFSQPLETYLRAETLTLKQTRAAADEMAKSILPAVPEHLAKAERTSAHRAEVSLPPAQTVGHQSTASTSSSSRAATSSKLPKWYKPPGK